MTPRDGISEPPIYGWDDQLLYELLCNIVSHKSEGIGTEATEG